MRLSFFSEREEAAIEELMQKMDLSRIAVLRQGLRILQLIQLGTHELKEVNPMPKKKED